MRERKERLTSKHIEDLKIATMSLEGDLMLPGGINPRKNSREERLLDIAEQGEETSVHYQALIAVCIKKFQEDASPTKLQALVTAYYWHAKHLSVLGLYYHYCTEQAPKVAEKRKYSQSAMAKSDALMQQIDSVLALYTPESDKYKEALEVKEEHTPLYATIKAEHEQCLPHPKSASALGKTAGKRSATASNTEGTLFTKNKKIARMSATLETQATDGPSVRTFS